MFNKVLLYYYYFLTLLVQNRILVYSKINYIIMEENKYISPEVEVLDVYAEGVLCGSTDLDMDPEEGYM